MEDVWGQQCVLLSYLFVRGQKQDQALSEWLFTEKCPLLRLPHPFVTTFQGKGGLQTKRGERERGKAGNGGDVLQAPGTGCRIRAAPEL